MDEGYSEEIHGSADGTSPDRQSRYNPLARVQQWPTKQEAESRLPLELQTASDVDKAELILNLLFTLPPTSISALSKQLIPFLHIDPTKRLPDELLVQTLTYLPVSQILLAATLSKQWHFQAMQPGLWRRKFITAGWSWDRQAVRQFEQDALRLANRASSCASASRSPKSATAPSHRINTRSATRARKDSNLSISSTSENIEMQDAPNITLRSGSTEQHDGSSGLDGPMDLDSPESPVRPRMHSDTSPRKRQRSSSSRVNKLSAPERYGYNRINWYHLYKQRRRLENNWRAGIYKNFQLPHACHPEEAHTECVYAVQFAGDVLVSGSRDHSIRIWSIATQRLTRGPLRAHQGSVLCLQFDAAAEEDVLISGSSDHSIVIWKLSTGTVLEKISRAHDDSVLNLRFNKEILVTCSKDKSIRIWNRRPLYQVDENLNHFLPVVGESCTDSPIVVPRLGERRCKLEKMTPAMQLDLPAISASLTLRPILPSYSLLKSLEGHAAAVNAVQIHKNQIASGSGDRTLKIWDWKSGKTIQTILGHKKGIACVQYDGRRIITGSSDDTIRIFDAATSAQVAELTGHAALVRTVQASFGDTVGSTLDDLKEASEVDARNWDARYQIQHYTRNGRLRSMDQVLSLPSALGARLPHGGGGSENARIVSGSYDERIVIWSRTNDGRWGMNQILKADVAVERATLNQLQEAYHQGFNVLRSYRVSTEPPPAPQSNPQVLPPRGELPQYKLEPMAEGINNFMPAQGAVDRLAASNELPSALRQYIEQHGQEPRPSDGVRWAYANPMPSYRESPNAVFGPWANSNPPIQDPAQLRPPGIVGDGWAGQIPNTLPGVANQHPGSTTRVFRLQFDPRMIVACTQDSRILGWDFAAGDEDILQACQYFTE